MALNPNAPKYPETDVDLLLNGNEAQLNPPIPPYSSPDYQVPNDQGQPEVDIDLLPGVPGQRGPTGPTGPAVTPEDILSVVIPAISYQHSQLSPANLWTINHNLSFPPNVTAFDSGGTQVEGNIVHLSPNSLTIQFSAAIAGNAILS